MKSPADQRANPGPAVDQLHPWLRIPDLIAIGVIAVIAVGAAIVSMMESYTNLLDFAKNHELHGWRSGAAPGAVDSFIIIGELLLFVAVHRGWITARETGKFRMPASFTLAGWSLTLFGFTLSVLGNLGHLTTAGVVTRMMSAVFPISATVAMAAGLMILKRVVQDHRAKIAARADIRPHGELLYLLGGFPAAPAPRPKAVTTRRSRQKEQPLPAAPAPAALAAAPAGPLPDVPRMLPDPAPRQGQVSRPIEMTSEIWAKLEAGVPAQKLAAEHPELGSQFRVKQIVKAHQEGRLGAGQHVDDAPVVWADAAVPGGE